MYITILILPLLSAIISGFLGRKIGVSGSHILSCILLLFAAILSLLGLLEVGLYGSPVNIELFNWIDLELLQVNWEFLFDSLTISILSTVLIVSTLVHIYSIEYISNDPHNQRFFSFLSLFTFFICILVSGSNYLVIFVGWEGIGVASFLLISFYTTRREANKSALQAILLNRVGDIFLTISFFIILWTCGSVDYAIVFSLAPYLNENILNIVTILFLLGAAGKSSQILLHNWLPNAIEGPTPVSSILHAATLVTAGIYLILRSSPLLEYAPSALILLVWVGAFSSLFAASCGLVTIDLKRTIAYSTISQIGYLIIACGLSQYNIALFHLCGHAYFKALLFLAAGGVLHSFNDYQDIRRLGGIVNLIPFTYTVLLIGSLSLCAFPYLTGFYSKDLIIELGYGTYNLSGSIVYWLGSLTALITAFYSFRLISITFMSYPNSLKINYENSHEIKYFIIIPLIILSLFSIFFGYLTKDLFVGIGSDFLSSALFTHPTKINLIESEFSINSFYKILPLIGTIIGALLGIICYHNLALFINQLTISKIGRKIYIFLIKKWEYDNIINYIIYKFLKLSGIISKTIDRGAIELLGPTGLSKNIYIISYKLNKLDSGSITDYSLGILISIISIGLFILYPIFNLSYIGDFSYIFIYFFTLYILI